MRPRAARAPGDSRLNTFVEILCVLVVVTAVAALIAWIVLRDSAGALFQG